MSVTLEVIGEKLDAIATAIAAIPAAQSATPVDLTPVLDAIADLKSEIVNKVEGAPAVTETAPTTAA